MNVANWMFGELHKLSTGFFLEGGDRHATSTSKSSPLANVDSFRPDQLSGRTDRHLHKAFDDGAYNVIYCSNEEGFHEPADSDINKARPHDA